MPKNRRLVNKKCFYSLIIIIGLIYGCASMRSPDGGPRDKTPPVALKMEPKNMTTNFVGDKVSIEFDEYFNLQSEFKEFSISPEQEKPPLLKKQQKKLIVSFQDSLEKNTTYTLNFGNAIVDVNEGNILKNFTYVFSTGPKLDSLRISGKVTNPQSGKPEIDATVLIIPLSRDSIFGKKKASIYTSTDSSGNFKLNNLREDTYKIYALKETGGDKIYQQSTDQVAFIKEPIVLKKNVDTINLGLFKELPTTFRILDKKFNTDGSITFVFNQQLVKPEVSVIFPKIINENKIFQFSKNNDSLKLWLKDLSFDSVKIAINSEQKPLDTVTFTRDKKDTYTRTIQLTDNSQGGTINPFKPYQFFLNFPTSKIDITKIKILEDSIPRTNFTTEKDSLDVLAYSIVYPWKNKSTYIITYGADAFTELFGTKNKEVKKTFKLASKDDYASLKIKVDVPEPNKSYIVELLNEKKMVVRRDIITKKDTISYNNYLAGIYFIRVVYDINKNGKWDTGNIKEQTQPEKIWYDTKEYSMKANWDREEILIIPKE
jgi:uncharacterized protein (DUF2141 family)